MRNVRSKYAIISLLISSILLIKPQIIIERIHYIAEIELWRQE